MDANFSERMQDILHYSKEEAIRLGSENVSVEHFFLGMLRDGESEAFELLDELGVDLPEIKEEIESRVKFGVPQHRAENIPLEKDAERVMKLTHLEAMSRKAKVIDSIDLLLAMLKVRDSSVSQILENHHVNYDRIKDELNMDQFPRSMSEYPPESEGEEEEDAASSSQNISSNSPTPVLDNFGIDLTKAAEENKLDPIVGRENEIERLVQILSRRKKNNPVLIGEPGVGKSAIAEGLALRIIQRKVSRVLFDKRIVTLDLASIVAGTKYRGQFEERMKSILNELTKTSDVILFIDEIHTIVGAGGATGSLDAANMLKPALARGEIQCIGATTLDEYRQYIEKDGALERRFQKVMVEPTSADETIEILNNIKERYEDHHNVKYTDNAIKACVHLTNRYISDRHLPDKAIDALDEAGSRVHISTIKVPKKIEELEAEIEQTKNEKIAAVKNQQFEKAASFRDKEQGLLRTLEREKLKWEKDLLSNREEVDEPKVEEVVAMMTGVPVHRIAQGESERLLQMGDKLQGSVVGQDDAIAKIVKAIQRNRAGLKDPSKPIGTFIFLGPTGVGKTQLAKVLSNYLFDSDDALIRIDMSEYMEKFSVSRLIGAPPGYIGYEEGGQLTERVRRKPYSVVLLDEIEKAHPDVFNLLLHVLDDGILTDSLGRKVDFKNTIVIMTSNIGTRQIKDFGGGVGFTTKNTPSTSDYNKGIIQKALNKAFAPEFLNRIDDVILFNTLDKEDIFKIIDIELRGLYKRVEKLGYKIELTEKAKDFVAEKGYDQKFGARPLKRAIQKYIEDQMAEVIIKASISDGDVVKVDMNEENTDVMIEVVQSGSKKETKGKSKKEPDSKEDPEKETPSSSGE